MRRYRKGQIFRPPTAAESAASADALEGFRRRPPESQEPKARGNDIVKTPEGGIDGRDGTTIFSATCTRVVESSEAGEKTLTETDEEMLVYNLGTADVDGDIYTKVSLTLGGTLCVDMGTGEVQSVVTDFRVSGVTFQVKTRDVFVFPAGDESDWTTAHTGGNCP